MKYFTALLLLVCSNYLAAHTGPGSITWTAQPNVGPERTATIEIRDVNGALVGTSTVTQASGCGWVIAPQSASFPIAGGGGSVAVTVSDQACPAWSAQSNVGWITVSLASGLIYTVAKNPGNAKSRTGTITVAGQSFTVTQAGKR